MLSIPAPMILLALLLAAGTGALAGKVTLSGLAPRLAPLPVTRDMKVCGNNKPDESVERSEEHTSELQSLAYLVCRLLLEKKNKHTQKTTSIIIYIHTYRLN